MSQLRDLIFIPEACHVPSGPKMATKIIHFIVNGKVERAEFGADCTAEDVKDLFCAAAEASPHHILKLYKSNGSVVNISPMLESNSQDSYYQLEVVASELQSIAITTDVGNMEQRLVRSQRLMNPSMKVSESLISFGVCGLRLCHLETKVQEEAGKTPEIISDLKSQVDSFKRKLESIKHLSWMGLFRDECPQQFSKFPLKAKVPQVNKDEEHREVRRRFLNMSSLQVIEEVREHLKTPTFDNWQWEEPEMLVLLQVMFTDLDLLTVFHFEVDILQNFLFEVYCHYNNIPFHNFQHCFCVTQMMYGLIWLTDLRNKLDPMDLLIMLTSALCHDLDHPGYSNVYQINAQTKLALRYNDISPLENHHCAVAFGILAKEESNILKHVTTEQYKHIRAGMIKCILATDMARHNEILNNFKSIQSVFDFRNRDHTEVLMKIMLKVSDISNEARPMAVAEPWLVCLLQEFFNQDTNKTAPLSKQSSSAAFSKVPSKQNGAQKQ
ncbi:high affinity cGMP-specific 3',5'-cyclic phosphodiesterase 9A-like isoform X5 [Hippocampus zosterae]|uniref:high affinity cGMP-specific 3',5'-cyclic phosphodiesterase 9A-like isoform X5 n=1 Tax=Hippocampus zosterae TaxID=109293 RepID=UPI00223CF784|nr:high affinity cGMP-specific 3',5'-cyclic phosphodiesterase 9A-like isoform X5 [Hippocampus zosterae]